jgi:hypothetical protein
VVEPEKKCTEILADPALAAAADASASFLPAAPDDPVPAAPAATEVHAKVNKLAATASPIRVVLVVTITRVRMTDAR